ncbi:hypothetical protein [Streptomyces turgidiscabies]|uniref:Secreted protein n=1 Tax=Streptomyces turgidiscabies TaxID=85558 RepID=A0ABU0RX57_9ACTN|nr:hypothetical protein [Streptomyces turgidiscabies]MDQ0936574.1 hypothetical protein [Streptomyces turgidiscabies]
MHRTLVTACVLSAALIVGGWDGDPSEEEVLLPDDFGVGTAQDPCDEIGPDTVPDIPDLLDGGGQIPDEDTAYGPYAQSDPCEGFGE